MLNSKSVLKSVIFFLKETINISDIDTESALVSNKCPFVKESLSFLLVINIIMVI